MQRRKFIQKSTLALGGLSLLSSHVFASQIILGSNKASRLKSGDKVGVITPGSALKPEDFDRALENIRLLGLDPVPSTFANQRYGFLGGTDYQRLSDLHEVFKNDEIKGVVCARGGYGSARIISNIDYSIIRRNPKVIIGFSDITALLNAVYQKTGLICFHGPVGASEFTEFTKSEFQKIIMNGDKLSLNADGYAIKEGKANGKLVGGNLSLITAMAGTRNEINFNGKIAFIEEVGESPYRIDRMLTQLIESGGLNNAKGIAFGSFAGCDVDPKDPEYEIKFKLNQVLANRCSRLSIPVYYGFDFGHVADNATIPVGLNVEFDASLGSIKSTESAVI